MVSIVTVTHIVPAQIMLEDALPHGAPMLLGDTVTNHALQLGLKEKKNC